MKTGDAIKQLRSIQDEARSQAESCHRDGEYDTVWDKDVEALDMAIDALMSYRRVKCLCRKLLVKCKTNRRKRHEYR